MVTIVIQNNNIDIQNFMNVETATDTTTEDKVLTTDEIKVDKHFNDIKVLLKRIYASRMRNATLVSVKRTNQGKRYEVTYRVSQFIVTYVIDVVEDGGLDINDMRVE